MNEKAPVTPWSSGDGSIDPAEEAGAIGVTHKGSC
jgi:hypothetical protein